MMKKILFLLTWLFSLQVYAMTAESKEQESKPVNLELEKGKVTNDDTYPRTLIPITCVYVDGMVQLSLLGDIGEFTLTVTNQLTGEQWSVANALMLETSTVSGTYWVEITISDGTTYCGSYTL